MSYLKPIVLIAVLVLSAGCMDPTEPCATECTIDHGKSVCWDVCP